MQVSRYLTCSSASALPSRGLRLSSLLQQPASRAYTPFFTTTTTTITRQFANMSSATTFYDFKPNDKKGQPYSLEDLKGKVVLVINTASKCGFTPQFEGLEKLYKELKGQYPNDVEFLGFPCNQFGSQDPGSDDEIQNFCMVNYGVSFPVLGKTDVNGDKVEPVWEWMKKSKPGIMGLQRIKWNFEKFLIAKDGSVAGRWASTTKPESLKSSIEEEIKKGKSG